MTDKLKLVQGDTGPNLVITVRDQNTAATGRVLDKNDAETWAPIDLTGASVSVKWRKAGSTTIKATLACTVLSPESDGRVKMTWGADTLDEVGDYEGEIEVTKADATVQTVYDLLKAYVRQQF